jgi:two-component system, LytTR family, sensor kinase
MNEKQKEMNEPIIIKNFSAEGVQKIKTDVASGNVAIFGGNISEIKVEISAKFFGWNFWSGKDEIQYAIKDFDIKIEQQNEELVVNISSMNSWKNWLSFLRFSVKIFVPNNKTFEHEIHTNWGNVTLHGSHGKHYFSTSAGQINIKNISGEVRGKTAAGTIEIKNCKGNINVSTSAGTIEIEKSEGEITLSTSAGTIELDDLVGNIYATTSAGTIEANRIDGTMKLSTSAGTIEVAAMRGSLEAYTGGGTIEAEILELGEFLDLESKAGNVYARMPFEQGIDLSASAYNVRMPQLRGFEGSQEQGFVMGKINGGGIKVNVQSKTGNVYLHSLKGGSFQNLGQSVKNIDFTLPPNFFARNVEGFFISLLICLFLVYGFNSIIYLSGQAFSNDETLSSIFKVIILNNIIAGIATIIVLFVFIKLENRIKSNILSYFVLFISTFFSTFISSALIWTNFRNTHDSQTISAYQGQNLGFFYMFVPPIVACIYYFLWQNSIQITKKISEQEFKLVSLEKLKTQAELGALQAKINPHFLYNSLNSIASLVHTDPDKAETMTMLLSKLFRYTTDRKNENFNTISDELEIVKTYLDIEQVRFGDRLSYSVELQEGLESIEIPRFLLQPIVENAIKHGISKIAEQGKIEIKISKENETLILAVHDNGPAFPEDFFTGYGLQSIQDKLKLLYGNKASFEVQSTDGQRSAYKVVMIKIKV